MIAAYFRSQWQHVLGIVFALIVGALALNAAQHLPIYSDEVAYKIFLERFIQNGWVKQSLTPYCAEGFLVRPAIPLWPAALLWTGIEELGHDVFSYRFLPLLSLGGIVGGLTANAWQKGGRNIGPLLLLIAIGPVLYGLIILRPEILILAAGVGIFFLLRPSGPQAVGLLIAKSSAAMIVFDLAAYLHPKTLYLTPLLIVGTVLTGRLLARPAARMIYWILMIIAVVSVVSSAMALHQVQFMSCHDVPAIEKRMNTQSLNPLDAVKNPSRFEEQVTNWSEASHHSLEKLFYQTAYSVNYLPGRGILSAEENAANTLIIICLYAALAYLGLVFWIAVSVRPFRLVAGELALIVAVAAGLLTPWILNMSTNWYEISSFMGALAVTGSLLRPIVNGAGEKQRIIEKFSFGVLGIVLVATAAWSFNLNDEMFNTKFRAGFEGPGLSTNLDRALVAGKVQILLKNYGVGQNEPLVIDDLSYEAVKYRPLLTPITYLGLGGVETEMRRKVLRRNGMRYGIFRCQIGRTFEQMQWRRLDEITIGPPQYDLCLYDLAS